MRGPAPALAARMERMAESATAAIFRRVAELRALGADVISLAVGEPDFQPPPRVRAAVERALADGSGSRYTEVAGLRPLRAAICADSQRRRGVRHEPEQVVVSAGAKHTLFNLAQALFDHGDEVVIPVPAWGSYAEQVRLCGATPVLLSGAEADGFRIRPEALAAALGPRTKALLLCTPNNPSGAAYDADALRALAEVLRRSGGTALVIVDEIYAELRYDGARSVSLLELAPDLRERIVVVDGVSKRYAMTGYRVGWMLGPTRLARACEAVQSQATTSVAALCQLAAQAALEGDEGELLQMRTELARRRERLHATLSALPGLRVRKPDGAFYLLAGVDGLLARAGLRDDVELARWLLERARVAVVPGSAFHAPGYVRLSFTTAQPQLDQAVERISTAIASLG